MLRQLVFLMEIISIIFIALGLSMDAFAVSIASGVMIHQMHLHHAMRIALFFGGFQGLMPLLGWICGNYATKYINLFDHWFAFILLSFIGIKMIRDAYKIEEEQSQKNPLNLYVLFTIAIATSIDAFAVGLTFSVLGTAIAIPVIIIGAITFFMSFIGAYIGNKFGHFFGKKIEIIGGAILILMGLKILIENYI